MNECLRATKSCLMKAGDSGRLSGRWIATIDVHAPKLLRRDRFPSHQEILVVVTGQRYIKEGVRYKFFPANDLSTDTLSQNNLVSFSTYNLLL